MSRLASRRRDVLAGTPEEHRGYRLRSVVVRLTQGTFDRLNAQMLRQDLCAAAVLRQAISWGLDKMERGDAA